MNILITNISAFPNNVSEFEYEVRLDECDVDVIKAKHTNESVLKCLSQLRQIKNSGGIKKIIALVSNKTIKDNDVRFDNLTAFEYFKKVALASFGNIPEIVDVRIENDEQRERDLYLVINEICSNISDNDCVYIDAAGGKRTTTNVIQLITNILEYKGINNPLTLYSDIQNNPKFITDTKAFEQLTDLADAFNEFMTSGKSNILQRCIYDSKSLEQYQALVKAMCEFSDNIKLGKVDDLDTTLMELRKRIDECAVNKGDNIESVVVNQFLPIIKKKFFGTSEGGRVDYIKLVEWCLENDLLQQALTIFTEKIPISIFEKKIICYNGDIEKEKKKHKESITKNPLVSHDWETAMFYSEIMTSKMLESDKGMIQMFIQCLQSSEKSSNDKVNEILKDIRNFKIEGKNKSKTSHILSEFCKANGFISEKSLINGICNNHSIIRQLLGLTDGKNKSNKMADKFAFVEALKNGKVKKKGEFLFSKECADVMYGYLYVKSVRNTVNHASSEDTLSEDQKMLLSEIGYDFKIYDFVTVKKNICKALEIIKNAKVNEEHEEFFKKEQ